MDRRTFLKRAASITGLAALHLDGAEKLKQERTNHYNLYWGDMHCHCDISYGRGSLEDAFKIASQHLDFCSVVGHSSWHDTPTDPAQRKRLKQYITYHDEGYERLEKLWSKVKKLVREVRIPGKFIPFLAFEWHSTAYGDHNVYYLKPEGEIVKANSIEELRDKMKGEHALIIPHHIAYLPGSRGIDWDHFIESPKSPFVEVYSYHGCSVTDTSPYPYLREMGPRSFEGTVEAGLKRGFKFGFIASTDNHYGYPSSYGEGLMAVYANELTPESLWEAFKARRVYAVTGDRIIIDFNVNNAFMGQELSDGNKRVINLSIMGEGFLDCVDLIKNGYLIKRFNLPFNISAYKGTIRAKVRIEWGWGRKNDLLEWEGNVKITDGRVISVTPYFRAQTQSEDEDWEYPKESPLISKITEKSETGCSFHSYSLGNPTPFTPLNSSVVLDVEMPINAAFKAKINGKNFEHTLAELLEGQRSHLIAGYLDKAVSFHRAVPEKAFILKADFTDLRPESPTDYYYIRVRQKNNQWAWSSPIWVKGQ